MFEAKALWSTSDALLVDCALTGAAHAAPPAGPAFPARPLAQTTGHANPTLPLMFSGGEKAPLHGATARRPGERVSRPPPPLLLVLTEENSRRGNEAPVGEAPSFLFDYKGSVDGRGPITPRTACCCCGNGNKVGAPVPCGVTTLTRHKGWEVFRRQRWGTLMTPNR